MNFNQTRGYQPSVSTQSTRFALPTSTTSQPSHPLYLNHQFTPLPSSRLSSSVPTQPYTTIAPSLAFSVGIPSIHHKSLQTPSIRPSPTLPPSNLLPSERTHSVPSKRARKHTPHPPTPTLQHPPVELPSERAQKRRRLNAGRSKTATNNRGSQPFEPTKPSPLSQPPIVSPAPPSPKPQKKKAPVHPLAVDWSRPVNLFEPRPPSRPLNFRGDRPPLTPYPGIPEPKPSLEEELRGPADPGLAKELAGLMWKQQTRISKNRKSPSDPLLSLHIPDSLLDGRSPSPDPESTPVHLLLGVALLYGPTPRSNESIHLGESLTNPDVIVLDDDEDGGFGEVLDLYRGAVQGSALSRELELAFGGDECTAMGWEGVSSLEVSAKPGTSDTSPSGKLHGSHIRTLTEHKQAEKGQLTPGLEIPREESLGIEWSYSGCGYATGRVVDPQKTKTRQS